MNGLTTVLTAQATVTYLAGRITSSLAVADANDFALDSNVFVQAGSLSSANVTANPTSLAFGNQAQDTTSASQAVTITNVGTTTVTITSIVASANFGETNSCPATLLAGDVYRFELLGERDVHADGDGTADGNSVRNVHERG